MNEQLERMVGNVVKLVDNASGQFGYGRLSKGEVTGLYRVIAGVQIDAVFAHRVTEIRGDTIYHTRGA